MNLACEPTGSAALPFEPCEAIDHPSGYLALSPRNQRFTMGGLPGFIAYREKGMHFIAFGGVHAPGDERAALLDGFLAYARRRMRRVLAVQVRGEQTELFHRRGFSVNQFGANYGLRLAGFSYGGTRRMKVRQKIKQARTAGLHVFEVGCAEWPADEATFARLREVTALWLAAKGKKELDFMVGELGQPDEPERRIFVVVDSGGALQGFITYVPVWGSRPGYLHDLTRRRPDAPVGSMELCNAHALERFAAERVEHLHFGFTPFVVEGEERPGANRFLAAMLRFLWRYGSCIYPAKSQAAYKLKWAPDFVEPEYVAARPFSLRAVLDLLLLTRSL